MHIKMKTLVALLTPVILLFAAAYMQWGISGLPAIQNIAEPTAPTPAEEPFGFPFWMRWTHYINLFLLILLIRSGLQILFDHPRLYWNIHSTPGTEWIRFTPVELTPERAWTSKEDSRYLTPWVGLPGRKHTVGMARHWHFLSILFWFVNGVVYLFFLFYTPHWRRLVPTSWSVIPDAWAVFVHYATLHMPFEPNGFYNFNALQQLTYFAVVFILSPLSAFTGPSMSPALTSRYKWYPKLPGNRQTGRSLHFLVMAGFILFIVIHVTMVAATGFARNMNHIVMGTDDLNPIGMYLGFVGIIVVILANFWAHHAAWKHPRLVQHAASHLVTPVMTSLLARSAPIVQFSPEDISPFFWANGKVPTSDDWKRLASDNFKHYRLRVDGLVENKVELSLEDLEALGKHQQITLHHCIQGWSGIAEWGGLPVRELINFVKPKKNATAVVFYSYGEGGEGGQYYESLTIENALYLQTLLAYEMNYKPLNHLHGAPLRLRVENQLGFKMVKWIESIRFVEDLSKVSKGEGGYDEDYEYFGEQANI